MCDIITKYSFRGIPYALFSKCHSHVVETETSTDHPFIKIKTFQNDDDEFEQYLWSNNIKLYRVYIWQVQMVFMYSMNESFWKIRWRRYIFNNDNNNNKNINAFYMTMNCEMKLSPKVNGDFSSHFNVHKKLKNKK